MKSVKFAKAFRNPISDSSYQEWPAGVEDVVSDEIAKKAQDAGALDGEPVDAPKPAAKGSDTSTKKA